MQYGTDTVFSPPTNVAANCPEAVEPGNCLQSIEATMNIACGGLR
jgi:hypothetical protein